MPGKKGPFPSLCSGGRSDGKAMTCRRVVERDRAVGIQARAETPGWAAAAEQSSGAHGHLVCAHDRNSLGRSAQGNGCGSNSTGWRHPPKWQKTGMGTGARRLAEPLAGRGQAFSCLIRALQHGALLEFRRIRSVFNSPPGRNDIPIGGPPSLGPAERLRRLYS